MLVNIQFGEIVLFCTVGESLTVSVDIVLPSPSTVPDISSTSQVASQPPKDSVSSPIRTPTISSPAPSVLPTLPSPLPCNGMLHGTACIYCVSLAHPLLRVFCDILVTHCSLPGHPRDGEMSSDLCNATVYFDCDECFFLFGRSNLTCQPNGEWDGDPPLCTGIILSRSNSQRLVHDITSQQKDCDEICCQELVPPHKGSKSTNEPSYETTVRVDRV